VSEESEALGELLRSRRSMYGMSLREAAADIGCSFSTLDRAERGIDVTFDNFVRFAKWLRIPLIEAQS
jgi:transcriptional regulator with XRE-family HTH domain